MRGGYLPPILVCAALGFALSFAPRRVLLAAIALVIVTAVAVSAIGVPVARVDAVFYCLWGSVVLTAGCVHLPKRVPAALALILAINTGLWSGAVTSVSGTGLDLATALPFILLCVPGCWLVASGRAIVLKVLASWLIAVAILAAFIPITTPTPGYVPDHME